MTKAFKVPILTSSDASSVAEEFCYNLKNLKRATIVGEVTGRGTYPSDEHVIKDGLIIFVPNGRAINPVTETNWESVGVTPDVPVASNLALKTVLGLIAV